MLCERCKIREASIRYTEVINGVKSEHNLCVHCAQVSELGQYAAIFDGEFPLSKLLSGILGMDLSQAEAKDEKLKQIMCPVCQTTYNEFVQNSRFGCPDCYGIFDLLINDSIKKLQGSDSHLGKKPRNGGSLDDGKKESSAGDIDSQLTYKEELSLLETKLKEAIRDEEFAAAAKYRDEIKLLKERDGDDA